MTELDLTTFPTRDACFGRDSTNTTCTTVSDTMVAFLNITDPSTFKQMYCVSPPTDSCAFGYCPNPDIASPAVRAATYAGTICLAITILYKPDSIVESFYAQLLQIYSLMIAAIVSIGLRQLTRLHAVFVLTAAGSPLSLYLLFHAIRSIFTDSVLRLSVVFGSGRDVKVRANFNRIAVFIGVPLWITILAVIARPSRAGWFQQVACDSVFQGYLVGRFFYGPVYLLLQGDTLSKVIVLAPVGAFIVAWAIALTLQRHEINKKNRDVGIVRRIWRGVTDTYPFLRFTTVIALPFTIWIAMLETGALFTNEYFEPTYGQVLAMAAVIPPLIQCITLLPRLLWWFLDLTWVRFISGRRNSPYYSDSTNPAPGSYHNTYGTNPPAGSKYSKLDDSKADGFDTGIVSSSLNRYSYPVSVSSADSGATVVPLNRLGDEKLYDSSPSSTPSTATFDTVTSTPNPARNYRPYSGEAGRYDPPPSRTPDNGHDSRGFVDPYDRHTHA